MKHDEESETKQNEAIRLLAGAVAGLASQSGHSGYKHVVVAVEALVGSGSPPAVEAVPAEPEKAVLVVSAPVPGDIAVAAADASALKKEVADIVGASKSVKAGA